MSRRLIPLLGGCLGLMIPALQAQEPPSSQTPPIVRDIQVRGVHELAEAAVRAATQVTTGEPLTQTPDDVARSVERRYRDKGYTFAKATAAFDGQSGILTLAIDEGVIDDVVFEGVEPSLARKFAEEFALQAGDVFNGPRARQALDALLRRTRGAIRPSPAPAFDLVERNGLRVLRVGLSEPAGRFKLDQDMGAREDWFTPVDGLVPSLGFGGALFDHQRFNNTYISGHLSYKMASHRAGYALGFERPLFDAWKLYLGGELHDLTATDDRWQVSTNEASIANLWSRRSYRDYYRRRGVQGSAIARLHPQFELLTGWRSERQEGLGVESDFSLWRRDQPFRQTPAQEGMLNALLLGASFDSRGFERESLETTYKRHQLDSLFGERLDVPTQSFDLGPGTFAPLGADRLDGPVWRIDWNSEISSAGSFGSDFDFSRHIVTGRLRVPVARRQEFGTRVIGGWSGGTLPPQREFGLGGIGSVHGYSFKEVTGSDLALINLEYTYHWRNGLSVLGFFDAGHVSSPAVATTPWLKGVGFGFGVSDIRLDFGYRLDSDFVNGIVYGTGGPRRLQVLLRFGRTF